MPTGPEDGPIRNMKLGHPWMQPRVSLVSEFPASILRTNRGITMPSLASHVPQACQGRLQATEIRASCGYLALDSADVATLAPVLFAAFLTCVAALALLSSARRVLSIGMAALREALR